MHGPYNIKFISIRFIKLSHSWTSDSSIQYYVYTAIIHVIVRYRKRIMKRPRHRCEDGYETMLINWIQEHELDSWDPVCERLASSSVIGNNFRIIQKTKNFKPSRWVIYILRSIVSHLISYMFEYVYIPCPFCVIKGATWTAFVRQTLPSEVPVSSKTPVLNRMYRLNIPRELGLLSVFPSDINCKRLRSSEYR
jgi:hypothetical protein